VLRFGSLFGRGIVAQKQNLSGAVDPDWAWRPYRPDGQRPWTLAWAGHLCRRAGFGAAWPELQEVLTQGPQKSIDRFLQPPGSIDAFNQSYDAYESAAAGGEATDSLRSWWLRRMIHTPHPLLEKMTLFWHSYFGISNDRVKNARLMQQHVQCLRRHALGSFSALLQAMPSDPAVLLSLDCAANRKAQANQNLARAMMEDYSLGSGQFSERDVHQAAQAFTGWFVMRGKLKYIAREHDDNSKTILGHTGNFTGQDVAQILVDHPATAWRLVRRLYTWLISEAHTPDATLVQPLADAFAWDHDIARLTETMLRSNLFFSAHAYHQRVKCPLEFAIGIIRGLEGMISTTHLGQDLAGLGQNLYYPPTEKGWQGARYWIDNNALTARHNLAVALLSKGKPYAGKLNPWALAKKNGFSSSGAAAQFMLDLFLQQDQSTAAYDALLETSNSSNQGGQDPELALRQFAHRVVTQAEFHLA
jgi:uncharacterized protein (DUF1800 family)